MRIKFNVILFLLFLCFFAPIKNNLSADVSITSDFSSEVKKAVDNSILKVKPALVRIHVVMTHYINGREVKHETAGSGVIIDPAGYVITNHHVVGMAKLIVCNLSNKEEIEADLIGTDRLTDISIIKLKSDKTNFPHAKFGDSDSIKVGDTVLAMGSPLALSQSVTKGIVSNTKMVMPHLFWPFNRFELEGENVGSIVRWIGHDAPIFGGNSGGPLVNLNGEIIGINEISMGLSGAIPGNLAKNVAKELIATGEVTRSWFGFLLQPTLKSTEEAKGVVISGIINDSPAFKAGFKSGDTLIKIDNTNVNVKFTEELPLLNQFLMSLTVNKEVEAEVLRNNKLIKIKITPEKRENVRQPIKEIKSWGMTASDISFITAQEMERESKDGVLVYNTRPGGPCDEAKPRINNNDIITSINSISVKNLSDLEKITNELIEKNESQISILVNFDRKKEKLLTVLKLGDTGSKDRSVEVKKAWLPIGIQVLTKDISEALKIQDITGVRVTEVFPEHEKIGLEVGDIIIELDGEKIQTYEPQDIEVFPALIRQYQIGSKVKLKVLRNLKEKELEVTLISSPPGEKEMKKYRDLDFEFTVRDIAYLDKVKTDNSEKNKGVLVVAVDEGGWAALAHLAVDDIILEIENIEITDTDSFENTLIKFKNKQNIVLKVKRGIYTMFVELEMKGADNAKKNK